MMRYLRWIFVWSLGCIAPLDAALLPEGFVLNGVSGLAVKDEPSDGWRFVPSTELVYMKTVVEKGTPYPILSSNGCDQIRTIAKDKTEIPVRVWGILTQYNKKNYLFPIQILPLLTPTPHPAEPEQKSAASAGPDAVSADPNGEDVISAELLAILRSQPRVDLAQLGEAATALETPADANGFEAREFSLIGKSGYVKLGQTNYFIPDAFGRKIETDSYILLPCLTLETVEKKLSKGFGKYRYNVSGIISRYQGSNYLLLYRAERTYSNRNFTP